MLYALAQPVKICWCPTFHPQTLMTRNTYGLRTQRRRMTWKSGDVTLQPMMLVWWCWVIVSGTGLQQTMTDVVAHSIQHEAASLLAVHAGARQRASSGSGSCHVHVHTYMYLHALLSAAGEGAYSNNACLLPACYSCNHIINLIMYFYYQNKLRLRNNHMVGFRFSHKIIWKWLKRLWF